MSRLPTPGGDNGTWGNVLNDFLAAEHNPDGTQKTLPIAKGGTGATDALTALSKLGAVSTTDSRLTDARTPTGTAAGVLSGSYPNPGFATDMATQAELDANAASSTPHSSTGDLTFASDSDANGAGDLIFKTANVERGRIGTGGLSITALAVNTSIAMKGTSASGVSTRQPVLNFYNNADGAGDTLKWQIALDVANSVNDDFVIAARGNGGGGVGDFVYLRDFSGKQAMGVAITPPGTGCVLQVGMYDSSAWDGLSLRKGASNTGYFVKAYDSANHNIFRIDTSGALIGPDTAAGGGGLTITSAAVGEPTLRLFGIGSQTGEYLKVTNSGGSAIVQIKPNGNNGRITLTNTADSHEAIVIDTSGSGFEGAAANQVPLYVRAFNASQSADIFQVMAYNYGKLSGFDKGGYFYTNKNAAPADADLSAGQMMFWFDPTNGASKLMVKAKQTDGTVKTASVALS